MNISELARASEVSADTIRYYEKQGLMQAPVRQSNGYRHYGPSDAERLDFIRGAQALGFSLQEIRAILPRLAEGTFGRADIERHLQIKMAQIDAHMAQLKTLKRELAAAFASLTCAPERVLNEAASTAPDSGSGVGIAVVRRSFAKAK